MENTNFKVYIEKTTEDYGCLYVEPLERGYGDTLGNALRRLLLSSIKGVAVTAVRIDGVLHEFSTIPGVREDVIEILMNLKHIPIKAKTERPMLKPEGYKLLTLDSDDLPKSFFTREENPGVITAKDLPSDSDFEFCGDGVLCTLEPGAHLVMEIYIEPGVGYLSVERERPAHLPLDALLTDAIFSPVKRVNYRIEPARVGQSIDYERLILEVWTNGAILPKDAIMQASGIAENYFAHIAKTISSTDTSAPSQTEPIKEQLPTTQLPTPEPDKKSITELGLSLRSENCLRRVGIENIEDLLSWSHDDLLKVRNLGKKSLTEIEKKLEDRELYLSPTSKFPDGIIPEEFSDSDSDKSDKKDKDSENLETKSEPEVEAAEPSETVEEEAVKEDKPKKPSTSKSKAKPKTKEATEDAAEKAEKTKKPKKSTKKSKEETTSEAPTEN